MKIFEFDKRFESFGEDFQFYDYNEALEENHLIAYASKFDLVIADPPFLSEECLEKTSLIVKRLIKDEGLIVLNTGSIQKEFAKKFLDLKETNYQPQHKNNLANEFTSFANFDLDKFMQWYFEDRNFISLILKSVDEAKYPNCINAFYDNNYNREAYINLKYRHQHIDRIIFDVVHEKKIKKWENFKIEKSLLDFLVEME